MSYIFIYMYNWLSFACKNVNYIVVKCLISFHTGLKKNIIIKRNFSCIVVNIPWDVNIPLSIWVIEEFWLTLIPPSTTTVPYANSLDQDEMPSNSASHPDPSCLTIRLHFHQFWAKLKQTRNLADNNLFGRLMVNLEW